jgi:hypothetical protein
MDMFGFQYWCDLFAQHIQLWVLSISLQLLVTERLSLLAFGKFLLAKHDFRSSRIVISGFND